MRLTKVSEFSNCASRKMTSNFPFKPSRRNQNQGKKRKRKNQSIKDRRKTKENRKEKQVLWTKRCLNNVQNCRKEK